jgi:hypothetical protein
VLQKRTLQDVVYTNNYSVTGRALKRLGIQAIFEHYRAQGEAGYWHLLAAKNPDLPQLCKQASLLHRLGAI